jgi:hypothetical protein
MRLATLGLFATLCLLLTSVSGLAQDQKDPKDLLIGTWEAKEKVGDMEQKITVEFTKDTIKVAFDVNKFDVKYKWVDKDNIEVTVTGADGKEMTEKTKIAITMDELTVSGKDKPMKFTRVKK